MPPVAPELDFTVLRTHCSLYIFASSCLRLSFRFQPSGRLQASLLHKSFISETKLPQGVGTRLIFASCLCKMSKRGMDAPLAEQMDRLKRSMQNRDLRRDQDREKRLVRREMKFCCLAIWYRSLCYVSAADLQVSKAADDPYAQSTHSRSATGGVNLGPGAAAQAAVLNAAALAGPVVIRCELCQVSCTPIYHSCPTIAFICAVACGMAQLHSPLILQ